MADPRPWSDSEKNELLAEIIKTASPNPAILLNVIGQHNMQPRWEDTPLPRGRSLNQCRSVFEEMRRTQPQSFLSGHYGPQTPLTAPLLKRPISLEPLYPGGREIRPKPYPTAGSVTSQPPTSEPAQKRKRGRPTKAQAQAKAAAAAETAAPAAGPSGPVGVAPAAAQASPQTTVAPVVTPAPPEEPRPPTTRMPISAVLTPTAPKTDSSSGSSSGKRRRTRSTRSEPEGYPMAEAEASGGGKQYESPYGRDLGAADPSPARTAAMRHRHEEQGLRTRQEQPPTLYAPRSEPPPETRSPAPPR